MKQAVVVAMLICTSNLFTFKCTIVSPRSSGPPLSWLKVKNRNDEHSASASVYELRQYTKTSWRPNDAFSMFSYLGYNRDPLYHGWASTPSQYEALVNYA